VAHLGRMVHPRAVIIPRPRLVQSRWVMLRMPAVKEIEDGEPCQPAPRSRRPPVSEAVLWPNSQKTPRECIYEGAGSRNKKKNKAVVHHAGGSRPLEHEVPGVMTDAKTGSA